MGISGGQSSHCPSLFHCSHLPACHIHTQCLVLCLPPTTHTMPVPFPLAHHTCATFHVCMPPLPPALPHTHLYLPCLPLHSPPPCLTTHMPSPTCVPHLLPCLLPCHHIHTCATGLFLFVGSAVVHSCATATARRLTAHIPACTLAHRRIITVWSMTLTPMAAVCAVSRLYP